MKTLETLEKGGKNPGKFRYGYALGHQEAEGYLYGREAESQLRGMPNVPRLGWTRHE
jgi:hypothetical protein